jgi:PAT family beta-lactamase induction signal transducer AmpG
MSAGALSDSRARRLVSFGAIYLAQGLPMGFAVFAVPAWLAEARVPTSDIGKASAMTMLPWAFKLVWAPLVDRWRLRAMGRFRAWILGAQLGLCATTLALSTLPSPIAHLRSLAGLLFAQALFASMSDVAGDGLAIEVLKDDERGVANAVMSGAQAAGNALGGAGLSLVLTASGFHVAASVELTLLLAMCTPTVLLRERPGERLLPWTRGAAVLTPADDVRLELRGAASLLVRALRSSMSMQALAVWVAAYAVAGALGVVMTAAAVRDHAWSKAEYASLGAMALAPYLLGAFVGGRLADRHARARVVAAALLVSAASAACFGALAPFWGVKGVWVANAAVSALGNGMLITVLTALFMDLAEPGIAATQFAVCMALGNLGSVLGRAAAGTLEARVPLAALLLAAGAVLAALAWWVSLAGAVRPRLRVAVQRVEE